MRQGVAYSEQAGGGGWWWRQLARQHNHSILASSGRSNSATTIGQSVLAAQTPKKSPRQPLSGNTAPLEQTAGPNAMMVWHVGAAPLAGRSGQATHLNGCCWRHKYIGSRHGLQGHDQGITPQNAAKSGSVTSHARTVFHNITWCMARFGSGLMTVLPLKSTRLPLRLPRKRPCLPLSRCTKPLVTPTRVRGQVTARVRVRGHTPQRRSER